MGNPRAKFVHRKKRTLAACHYPENRGLHCEGLESGNLLLSSTGDNGWCADAGRRGVRMRDVGAKSAGNRSRSSAVHPHLRVMSCWRTQPGAARAWILRVERGSGIGIRVRTQCSAAHQSISHNPPRIMRTSHEAVSKVSAPPSAAPDLYDPSCARGGNATPVLQGLSDPHPTLSLFITRATWIVASERRQKPEIVYAALP
ncbi:hypothetical protein DFH08DRAFT_806270 [Mycena albidolilacea]|uniref:Uncharacterized protein n=1 Tax=Mycena albidolilacea TaxID=1033008 RepID=A0AAD7A827_9AGAR|nr:hypothetical protein DFH08DRAFT_806270 [Mycena albidolilacea]